VTEDRDKRDWREIDRKKDRSTHRQDQRKPKNPKRPTRASGRYRAALERAFESGDLGKVAERLTSNSPTEVPGEEAANKRKKGGRKPSKQKLMHQITGATDRKDLVKKLDKLIEHYGLPDEFDVLTRALEHPDEAVLEKVLVHLKELLEQEKPRRAGTLKARLRLLEEDYDTPEDLKELAVEVQKLL
jgi:hypothetical protein